MLWSTVSKVNLYPDGKGQGYFRYYKTDGTFENIMAINGKLYKEGNELPIEGLSSFQTERQIEAVQFKDTLYIATGTKLVAYNGTVAKVIVPYKPEPLEALYIGTNALADDPDNYLEDGTSAYLQINGIQPEKRYGISTQDAYFKVYISKPTESVIEYKMEWRILDTDAWTVANDWTTSNRLRFASPLPRDYQLRFVTRIQGTAEEIESLLPRYTVKELDENKKEDTSTIQTCNRILLHWERIILYGDPKQKDMIYISDVGRPEYFPTMHTLRFENEEQEGLTALIKYRDMLVAFTPHTVQGLYGKSPYDYSRLILSSSVGCIAPYSAQVFENYIGFLSFEGVYILKSVGYSENRANVEKIDSLVDNIMPRDTDACAIVANGQYQLTFPSRQQRFRFYYQDGVWTKDESPKLEFGRMYEFNGEVYGQMVTNSAMLKMDRDTWHDDGHVYTDRYVFKDYDFGEPYNPKKLKEMQVLLGQSTRTNLSFYVYADGSEIISPDASYASIDGDGNVVWNDRNIPNVTVEAGTTLNSWMMGKSGFGNIESAVHKLGLSGKCRRVRVEIVHDEPTPNNVLGVGFIFKSKKP